MSLPTNTASILLFLGYQVDTDFSVGVDNLGVTTFIWYSVSPEPTEQEIIDAGNDLTIVNGQVFSEWYAENGGDATLTGRKKARDLSSGVDMQTRAVIHTLNQRVNWLTNRLVETQETLVAIRDATFGTQARDNVLPGFPMATSTRPLPQAIQDYVDDIDSGAVDT